MRVNLYEDGCSSTQTVAASRPPSVGPFITMKTPTSLTRFRRVEDKIGNRHKVFREKIPIVTTSPSHLEPKTRAFRTGGSCRPDRAGFLAALDQIRATCKVWCVVADKYNGLIVYGTKSGPCQARKCIQCKSAKGAPVAYKGRPGKEAA